jgi:hypothetical protein
MSKPPKRIPKKALRITRDPETFIFPVRGPKGSELWKLVNTNGRSIGIYGSESEAKHNAISHAQRFFRTPKEYRDQYQAKLNSFERLRRDLLGRDDED